MTADTKEYNVGCEGQKVGFEGRAGSGMLLEKDRKGKEDYNGIGPREGEESGGDESEGSFVMVNEDSDDPAERDLDLGGKAVPVETEESGGPPANVGPSAGEVVAGDRETGGEKGGDHEGVDSVVNSETGVEDRKDAAAVSGAKEENMESETNPAAEVEERKEKEVNGQGESESNNGVVNNDVELEGEQEEETVAIDSELQVEPESVDKEKLIMTETDDQIRSEFAVEVEERQEPDTVVTETNHQAELESATDVEDRQMVETVEVEHQDTLTTTSGTGDRVEAESAVGGEAREPQIVSTEKNDQEQLEVVVHVEEKLEIETAAEAGNQGEPEAIAEVGERQKPESVVRETTTSESLPLEHEEVRLSTVAEEGPADDCSSENATASEGQCRTKLETADSGESPENHEASSICQLDGKVKEAESSAHLETLKNSSVCHVGDQELVKEVEVSNKSAENGEASHSETETGIFSADEPGPSGPVSGADLEPELINASTKSEVEVENVLGQCKERTVVCSKNDTGLETKVCSVMEIEKDVSTNHAVAMKSEPEIDNGSAEGGECLASSVRGNEATRKDDDKEPIHEEVEVAREIQARPEGPSGSTLEGEKVDTQMVKWQRCYIIRVPRFTDDELWEQIKHAQLELEEKTRSRDSIGVAVQKKKANCNEYRERLETAKAKERAARAAFNAKRQEIESVQSILNKLKNATSIEEIDNQIEAMDHEFQHSTMGLKEEKQHLHNIKQLRHLREQLSSIMGTKSEIDMAFDQRDQIEEHFKTLKKELDSLKADLSEAEIKIKEVRKEYDDEVQHLRDVQQQFRTADEIRQKAYGHWRDLKNESMEKVEKVMELWNNNNEFRMQYMKSNRNSTLRRLRTLDGRSLGPNEEPPALRTTIDKSSSFASKLSNINPPVAIVASEAKPGNLGTLAPSKEEFFPALQAAQTNHSSKSKKSMKPMSKETIMAVISDREEVEAAPKEKSRTKEEEEQARKAEELARKEEELRKKKAEAEMKERLRLEQKEKAKEAEERKRRKAEKAQARAEHRAQKEAELREKKKLKKEKKKASPMSDTTNGGAEDSASAADGSPPENAPEPGARAVHVVYMGSKSGDSPDEILRQNHHMLAAVHGGSLEKAQASHVYSYGNGFRGFAAKLSKEQASDIAAMPGVVSVFPNLKRSLHTTHSWDFMGLATDEAMEIPGFSTKNQENVIIGFIDTESPSFGDHGMPPVPSRWKGKCQTGESFTNFSCNKKIIGARCYLNGYEAEEEGSSELPINSDRTVKSPRDGSGHGSHTASIAAGRRVKDMNYNGLGAGGARGGAPMARIAIYKSCWDAGCYDADLLAAFDGAIKDGVDMISVSLGPNSPQGDYFSDAISVGSFHAASHDILVVSSAGNAGTRGSATNLAPWMLTVAASSTDREFASRIILGGKKNLMGESLNTSKMKASARIISASDTSRGYFTPYQSSFCLDGSLNETRARGKVLICRHSGSLSESRLAKSLVVKKAGGVGMILIDEVENDVAVPFVIPAASVGKAVGARILSYVDQTRKPRSFILPAKTIIASRPPAPRVAAFSSKGPNYLTPEILKPDIAAPGLNILAAWSPADKEMNYNILSGTSMSCPHVTGLAALIKAVHPTWSPSAIKSAIMTSATTLDKNGNVITADPDGRAANPFDYGSGFPDPTGLLDPGLIYDAQAADYKAFLCSVGYDDKSLQQITGDRSVCIKPSPLASNLNYPSITVPDLKGTYSITRTVTNVGQTRSVYRAVVSPPTGINVTVIPGVLIFKSYSQKLNFTVNFRAVVPSKDYVFGSLSWKSKSTHVTSPLVVRVSSSKTGLL
ncbi:putative Subtilisin-like protease SBT3.6 [Cocos nucifera]|uniref:Putative Subtilisin-like protease SBT3.6 n=1 Tax=Cocos nucifera TaxID=13894 RepID=A0A8K0INM5_COCNU|nr:putative Subtilisin-like protease SBT3.6 [Cocos nucifera]